MRKLFLLLWGIVFFASQALAQRVISGKVTDDKGKPLPNVSVLIRGTTTGTTTKDDGTYSLTIPANAKALVFSSVDMSPVEKAIGSGATLDATLKNEDKTMSEVVVTAFGIKKDKKTLGYGVTQINAEELTRSHTTNITNALAGKIPGVRVSGSGGSFTGSSIIIRGYTTFTGSNQPLFVIDGIPIDNGGGGSPLQNGPSVSNRAIDINQEDIESMSVLKGPSAAVIYGSRGANGVIVITTKKGKAGQKSSIQFSSSYQVESANRIPDYQNDYAQGTGGVFSAVSSSSWGPAFISPVTGLPVTVTNAYNPATNLNNRTEVLKAYPNNVSDILQHGINWQNNIAFSGGTDKNTFRFSYGYLKNTGVINNNVLSRHNFSLNTSSKINNYLTVSVGANYSNNASRRTQQGNQLSNPLFRGWFTPRSYDLTGLKWEDAAGNQLYPLGEDNPYWTIKHNRYKDEINRFIGNVSFNFKLNKWLQADYKIGTDVFSTFRHAYDQIGARGGANTTANAVGAVREIRNQYRSFGSNGYFTANKRFKNFTGSAVVGTEFNQIYSAAAQLDGKGIIVRDFEQLNNTTTFSPSPSNGSSKTRLLGLYGDFTVGYKSIFSLNVTLRNDWSSTFKIGKNSYLYNGVGGSINFTEWIPNLKNKVIESIKIRGNIATVGKAGDFVYSTDSYFAGAGSADGFGPSIAFPFNGIQGFTLSNGAGNPNLGPEFTRNKEVAFELAFFKGRLNIEATHYWQDSRKLIFGVPVSATSGITSVVRNAGNLSNIGNELGITATPVKTKSFSWNFNFSYTQFKSYVDKLEDGVLNIFLGGFVTPNVRLVVGDEYGQIYGNAYLRDVKTGKIIVNDASTTANTALWGLPRITSGVQKIGNPNPKYQIGFTNTLTYKNLSLTFLIDYKKGGDQYSRNIADLQRNGAAKETAEFPRFDATGAATKNYMFDAVYTNGQPNTTKVTAEQYWGNSGKFAAAEGFIYETTWFRIREASMSYSVPSSVLNKLPFGNVELSVFGRNLFLNAPHYPHLDPEQNALGISNAQGLEFNALPQTRSIGVSLKLGF
ncbi:MAG: SusC/RagA family TonB-linked outer membrane protein [Chitinophagaceae bacterium]|nr:SusC/RagA family TonB-linked outer membrane protein [Chitinophagaceae bacterium]